MDADTEIGGRRSAFPTTHRSLVQAASADDASLRLQAYDAIVATYWKPVYKYLRIRWHASNEDAKDLTQAFFAGAVEKSFFEGYDSARAKFRTFLRTCLDRFVMNDRQAASRDKRGGHRQILSLDFDAADSELARSGRDVNPDPDDYFRGDWVRSLFSLAVESLRHSSDAAGRNLHFKLFERYDLSDEAHAGRASYQSLADEFGISVTQVTNHLHRIRAEFRRHLLDQLRAACGSDEEFRDEAKALLGTTPE